MARKPKRTPAEQREYDRTRKAEWRRQKAAAASPPRSPGAPPPRAGTETLDDAKRRRAVADADRAEIARDVAAGRLVDRETVERNLQRAFGSVRAMLDALPRALAGVVPAEHGPAVRAIAERETERTIDGLRVELQRPEGAA